MKEHVQSTIKNISDCEFAFPQSSWASRFEFGVYEDTEIKTETGSESEEGYHSYDAFGSGNWRGTVTQWDKVTYTIDEYIDIFKE